MFNSKYSTGPNFLRVEMVDWRVPFLHIVSPMPVDCGPTSNPTALNTSVLSLTEAFALSVRAANGSPSTLQLTPGCRACLPGFFICSPN